MEKINFSNLSSEEQENINLAVAAQKKAYAPYSHFPVGALAVSSERHKFTGCNIESADYTLTSHAEMTAINNMVAQGDRVLHKIYIALHSPDSPPVPCGLCRQKMTEFAESDNIDIITIDTSALPFQIFKFTLNELYPYPFSKKYL